MIMDSHFAFGMFSQRYSHLLTLLKDNSFNQGRLSAFSSDSLSIFHFVLMGCSDLHGF